MGDRDDELSRTVPAARSASAVARVARDRAADAVVRATRGLSFHEVDGRSGLDLPGGTFAVREVSIPRNAMHPAARVLAEVRGVLADTDRAVLAPVTVVCAVADDTSLLVRVDGAPSSVAGLAHALSRVVRDEVEDWDRVLLEVGA
jgi:hypothetical protein